MGRPPEIIDEKIRAMPKEDLDAFKHFIRGYIRSGEKSYLMNALALLLRSEKRA